MRADVVTKASTVASTRSDFWARARNQASCSAALSALFAFGALLSLV
jgi:hypothetical protein